MAVRTHVPWYVRWLLLAVLLAFSVALAAWMYDAGRRFAGFDRSEVQDELTGMRRELDSTRGELERLRAIANAADSKLSIERTAQVQLARQIRTLEQDNARLREDLAIFESMLSADTRSAQALTIQRFKVEPDGLPGEYRYRMLLLTGNRRERGDFQGRLELLVGVQQEGRNAMIVFPDRAAPDAPAFKLSFRNFYRVEGTFRVDPQAKVGTVQVRVFEAGAAQARATQSVTLGS
ncbi:MAG: hypothetical protein JSS40_14100 [Proteobacteria bacterium]|nr:hypothetical protein [Pseudomonadota bacterium]